MNQRKGDWFQTYSGRVFWLLDPRAEDVCLEDIAHPLANQCRFNGHTRCFYSVAQHSVLVSGHIGRNNRELGEELGLWGLMHDAAEAYLGDMVKPLKLSMPDYRAAEARVMSAICEHFGLPVQEPPAVKWADRVLLATERRDLMMPPQKLWDSIEDVQPMPEEIIPWPPMLAKDEFTRRFKELVL